MDVLLLCHRLNCIALYEEVLGYVCSRFSTILASSHHKASLKELPKELLMEILSDDDLAADSELDVLTAVMEWVAAAPEQRQAQMPDVMSVVRVGLLPTDIALPDSLAATASCSLSNRGTLQRLGSHMQLQLQSMSGAAVAAPVPGAPEGAAAPSAIPTSHSGFFYFPTSSVCSGSGSLSGSPEQESYLLGRLSEEFGGQASSSTRRRRYNATCIMVAGQFSQLPPCHNVIETTARIDADWQALDCLVQQ